MKQNHANSKEMNYSSLIKERLGEQLYRHSLNVAKAAVSLAEHYGADTEKAKLAGLVHDYGKRYSMQDLIRKAELLKLPLDGITKQQVKLLHAPVGAALLENELKISDPEIIKAVAYHTTGRRGMALLEKITYLADYVEEGRQFEEVEYIRKIAYCDLDQALLVAVDTAIRSILDRGLMLHPRSVDFRNSLLEDMAEKV